MEKVPFFVRRKLWFSKWINDGEGCIGLSLFGGLVTLVKYKHSTLVYWFKNFHQCEKYDGMDCKDNEWGLSL